MTRIIAGAARGRRLVVPAGSGTRPTADRAREALFSTLEAMRGGLDGARVLDLYAGSGAVGLEALSRGAAEAVLVESSPTALRAIRANVAAIGLAGAQVRAEPVERLLSSPPAPSALSSSSYDVVFSDPPYELPATALAAVLDAARRNGWLGQEAVVVVERASRDHPWTWPGGFVGERSRRYGEATLWYGRAAGPAPGPPSEE